MSPPQLEIELVNTRTMFNEALEGSNPDLHELGGRYLALLGEYLVELRKQPNLTSVQPTSGHPTSLGAAAKPAYQDWEQWALAEQEKVSAALSVKQADQKRGTIYSQTKTTKKLDRTVKRAAEDQMADKKRGKK